MLVRAASARAALCNGGPRRSQDAKDKALLSGEAMQRQVSDNKTGRLQQRSASTGMINSGKGGSCRATAQRALSLVRRQPTPTRGDSRSSNSAISTCRDQHGDSLACDAQIVHSQLSEFRPPCADRDASVAAAAGTPDPIFHAPLLQRRPSPPSWEPVALGPCLPLASSSSAASLSRFQQQEASPDVPQRPSTPTGVQQTASLGRARPPSLSGIGSRPASACSQSGDGSGTPSHAARVLLGAAGSAVVKPPALLPRSVVQFVPTPNNSFRVITPYSKVYGQHPDFFEFNRKGQMELNDLGIANELRQEIEAGLGVSSLSAGCDEADVPLDEAPSEILPGMMP